MTPTEEAIVTAARLLIATPISDDLAWSPAYGLLYRAIEADDKAAAEEDVVRPRTPEDFVEAKRRALLEEQAEFERMMSISDRP